MSKKNIHISNESYDNTQKDICTILKEKYPNIYEAMTQEDYNPQNRQADNLIKFEFDDLTVGYVSFMNVNFGKKSLQDAYIIPEYRKKGLFTDYLLNEVKLPNNRLIIKRPTIALVKMLMKLNLAIEISNNIVYSYIPLATEAYNVYKNKNIKRLYKKIPDENSKITFMGDLYDLNLGCIYFFDLNKYYAKNEYTLCISLSNINDMKKYKLRKKLNKVNESYIVKVNKESSGKIDKIHEFDESVNEEIDSQLSIENVMGSEDNLNENYLNYVLENDLSHDDAISIYGMVKKALDEEEIVPKSMKTRIQYLVENFNNLPEDSPRNYNLCNFCKNDILIFDDTCSNCGHSYIKVNEDSDEYYDNDSGLDYHLYDRIIDEGLNPQDVSQMQYEGALYYMLAYNDLMEEYLIDDIDEIFKIRPSLVFEKALDEEYINMNLDNEGKNLFFELLHEYESQEEDDELLEVLQEYSYNPTDKAREYVEKNNVINQYIENILHYDYYQFKQYVDNHTESQENIIENFLDYCEEESYHSSDDDDFTKAINAKFIYYDRKKDHENLLITLIKSMMITSDSIEDDSKKESLKSMSILFNLTRYAKYIKDYDYDILFDKALDEVKIDISEKHKEIVRLNIKEMIYADLKSIMDESLNE